MNFPVFDLHCDTALKLLGLEGEPSKLLKNQAHIDLERAGTLPGYCQCFGCFTTAWENLPKGKTVADIFEGEMDAILGQIDRNSARIRQAFCAEDVRKNQEEGLMSGILTMEGTAGIGYDPALLEDLFALGFRIASLGWNEKNPLTGSQQTGGGLTDRGREFVREAQRLGIAIDVSHISDEGFWDIMEITQAPIVATHSNSRAIQNHPRNLTDDMFLAICQSGGVAGFNQCAPFVGEAPDLDTCCDHIFHFLELDPQGTHIALGGDLDGCDTLPQGFEGVQSYPSLAQRLLDRGAGEPLVRRIFWDNALDMLDCCTR